MEVGCSTPPSRTAHASSSRKKVFHSHVAESPRKLVQEPRLADAGLADNPRHLPLAGHDLSQKRLQGRQFACASDERAQEASTPAWHPCAPYHDLTHPVDRQQLRQNCHVGRVVGLNPHLLLHEPARGLTHQNSVGAGQALEATRHVGGVVQCRVERLGILFKWADDNHSGVESHAGGEGYAASWRTQRRLFMGALLQLEGCQHRPSSMVFMCHGGTEEGYKAVAEPLHECPRVALDHTLRQGQEGPHEAIHRL
jgi:hypothetical protein